MKRKIRWFVSGFLIIILLPVMLIGIFSIVGEGMTYEAISASIRTKKAFDAMLSEDYNTVAEYIGFWGYSADRQEVNEKNIEDERIRFVNGLESFFVKEGRKMTGYDIINFNTDDSYTIGTVCLYVQDGSDAYRFAIRLSMQGGKLCPMDIPSVMTECEDREKSRELADRLIRIIETHYSG